MQNTNTLCALTEESSQYAPQPVIERAEPKVQALRIGFCPKRKHRTQTLITSRKQIFAGKRHTVSNMIELDKKSAIRQVSI